VAELLKNFVTNATRERQDAAAKIAARETASRWAAMWRKKLADSAIAGRNIVVGRFAPTRKNARKRRIAHTFAIKSRRA